MSGMRNTQQTVTHKQKFEREARHLDFRVLFAAAVKSYWITGDLLTPVANSNMKCKDVKADSRPCRGWASAAERSWTLQSCEHTVLCIHGHRLSTFCAQTLQQASPGCDGFTRGTVEAIIKWSRDALFNKWQRGDCTKYVC